MLIDNHKAIRGLADDIGGMHLAARGAKRIVCICLGGGRGFNRAGAWGRHFAARLKAHLLAFAEPGLVRPRLVEPRLIWRINLVHHILKPARKGWSAFRGACPGHGRRARLWLERTKRRIRHRCGCAVASSGERMPQRRDNQPAHKPGILEAHFGFCRVHIHVDKTGWHIEEKCERRVSVARQIILIRALTAPVSNLSFTGRPFTNRYCCMALPRL